MKEENRTDRGNGAHSYDVQKIEVLDEESPSTLNGVGSHPQSEIGSSYPLTKLLNGVDKSYDAGKKFSLRAKKAMLMPLCTATATT